jgi:hypothetical protein
MAQVGSALSAAWNAGICRTAIEAEEEVETLVEVFLRLGRPC